MAALISPLFYVSRFYTLLGLLSILHDSALAFRLVVAILLALQAYYALRAAKAVCADRYVSSILAFGVSANVFRVISVHECGPLTEFAAVAFLNMSVCTFMVLLLRIATGERDRYGWVSTGLFYSIASTIHPLTGFYGGIVLGLLGIVGFAVLGRLSLLIFGLSNAAGAALMPGPWLEPMIQFGKLVHTSTPNLDFMYFQGSVASGPLSALNPWSYGHFREDTVTTNYEVSVPVALALLILSVAGLILWKHFPKQSSRTTRNLLCSVLALSCALGVICMLVGCSSVFGNLFGIVQFPHRLVAYVNLCLLLIALCLFGMVDWQQLGARRNWPLWRVRIAVPVILIAALGLISKLAYVQAADLVFRNR
ncbi:MAG: hypothetical protein JO015_06075 [Verrucomicrobia bacterium]|nr:hypothetical protein [Verrucomicrobiota bacterium]